MESGKTGGRTDHDISGDFHSAGADPSMYELREDLLHTTTRLMLHLPFLCTFWTFDHLLLE